MRTRITFGDSTARRWTTTAAYTPIRRVSTFKNHHSIAPGPSDTAQSTHSGEKTLKGGLALPENISPASTPPAQPPLAAPPAPEASAPVSGEGTGEDTVQVTGPDYRALYEEARAKLTRAETAARENRAKAARLDEIEAANERRPKRSARWAVLVRQPQARPPTPTTSPAQATAAPTGAAAPQGHSVAANVFQSRRMCLSCGGCVSVAADALSGGGASPAQPVRSAFSARIRSSRARATRERIVPTGQPQISATSA